VFPGHSELAMGAIAVGIPPYSTKEIIEDLHIPQSAIATVIAEEKQELIRREQAYRGDQPFPSLKDKTIILVDDGIATGATIRAAIKALRSLSPSRLVVAVPVAQNTMCDELKSLVDEFVCPMRPQYFMQWALGMKIFLRRKMRKCILY